MSVINKMLRDLDKRQVQSPGAAMPSGTPRAGDAGASPAALVGFGGGTLPVAGVPGWAQASAPARRRATLWMALGFVLAVATVAGWWLQQRGELPGLTFKVSVATTQTTPAPSAAVPLPSASESVTERAPPPAPTPAPAPLPIVIAVPSEAPMPTAAPLAQAKVSGLVTGLTMDTTLAMRKSVESSTVQVPPLVALPTPALPESRPPASQEALLRAQSLWNAGSRDAAMDWLQEAIAVAERSPVVANDPAGNPLLLPLVREQARMLLVEGRYTALWELLSRLEPQLGAAPELWALRANAAQRLGRHQDSVHAYMMALQARPDEQRWMLGAAVSLAALGQTTSAAEMAERARAMGVVSKDVLTYLRQMGVPLK